MHKSTKLLLTVKPSWKRYRNIHKSGLLSNNICNGNNMTTKTNKIDVLYRVLVLLIFNIYTVQPIVPIPKRPS